MDESLNLIKFRTLQRKDEIKLKRSIVVAAAAAVAVVVLLLLLLSLFSDCLSFEAIYLRIPQGK